MICQYRNNCKLKWRCDFNERKRIQTGFSDSKDKITINYIGEFPILRKMHNLFVFLYNASIRLITMHSIKFQKSKDITCIEGF